MFSQAADPLGIRVYSFGPLIWRGIIYAQAGVVDVTSESGNTGNGGVFAWRAGINGRSLNVVQDGTYCLSSTRIYLPVISGS